MARVNINGTESIGAGAFSNCISLIYVDISNVTSSISPYALYNCSSLTSVYIPSSVKKIGEGAFANCGKLRNINIPQLDDKNKLELSGVFGNKHFERNNFRSYPKLKILDGKDSKNEDLLPLLDIVDHDYSINDSESLQDISRNEVAKLTLLIELNLPHRHNISRFRWLLVRAAKQPSRRHA